MLEVNDLCIGIRGGKKLVKGITFRIEPGKCLALVGESGSGKSLTALSVLQLLDPPLQIASGQILFEGIDLLSLSEKGKQAVRGAKIGMVFQDPHTALNPVLSIGKQIGESLKLHTDLCKKRRKERVLELMSQTGIQNPKESYHAYPFQFSGGMKQRAVIAGAIACGPKLLIADEPTSALDYFLGCQVMDLIHSVKQERQMGVLFITHDMAFAGKYADDILVIRGGEMVEAGETEKIFGGACDPYTRMLIEGCVNE